MNYYSLDFINLYADVKFEIRGCGFYLFYGKKIITAFVNTMFIRNMVNIK